MSDTTCLCITLFNRSHLLNRSLERLTRLTPPTEVLVIDDGSSDNCEETVKNFQGRLPVSYIYNNNKEWSICSMARNIGLKNTECDIFMTAEPEMLFMTDVVAQMLQKHQEIPEKVITAGTIYHMGQKATLHPDMITDPINRMRIEAVSQTSHNTNPDNPAGYAKIQNWSAPFIALYRREWLMELGGFDEDFKKWGYDDVDLLRRLSANGIQQHIDWDIEAIHQWHEKLPPHVQYEAVIFNEKLMLAKNINREDPNNNLIANKNREWGVIKL